MSVRLFGVDTLSSNRFLGVVEILIGGRWGVLCKPTTTSLISQTICEGLGHGQDDTRLRVLTVSECV